MEDKYSLEGKLVTIFLRGSWEFTGRVEFSSKDKIVLMSDMGPLVIYKENVVAAMIVDETRKKDEVDPQKSPTYHERVVGRNSRPPSLRIDFDPDQQDQYGSIIPEDMLEKDSEYTAPTDFSMSMFHIKNIKAKEKADGSTEEAPSYRGKNKA
jgi:hypothetical protein